MGAVWLARDTLLSRDVAVKQVTSTEGLDTETAEEVRERTLREGRNAAKLTHPHSIAMYDVAIESGEPWLVMEYFPARSLAQAMNLADTLPPLEVAQIGAQIAAALTEAHAAGIVHRDIKPGNILIADRASLSAPSRSVTSASPAQRATYPTPRTRSSPALPRTLHPKLPAATIPPSQ